MPKGASADEVTQLVQVWAGGDKEPLGRFTPKVFRELRENTQHG